MKCPTCDKPVQWQDNPYRPFCSDRCRLIDLGAWVNEEYTVPGERVSIPDEPNGSSREQPVGSEE
ncbi:MAG: DNA gyrase inhibitor YacG [Acidobacteriota bacterium]|nr:DNA gyrase inhibitor YacG [Acidobacteriota bacterium]